MLKNRNILFLTVFFSGMTTLAVEFTASRMLQTMYGTSNIVWANVIGLVMLFLTVGYFFGGRIADKYPIPMVFYGLMTAAGFSSVFFLLLSSVLLRKTTMMLAGFTANGLMGAFLCAIMAIAVPITLLGCISPFAIRLGVDHVDEAGRISGRIYAISIWGSLLGTYLPVLWIIPTAGSRMAAVIFGSMLILAGLTGIWHEADTLRQKMIPTLLSLLLLPFIFVWSQGHIKDIKGQVFETESPYN